MFSSIDPCAPLTCDFLAIDFPPLGLQHVFYPGLHCYQPIKRFIRTCFLITSQSAPSCFTVHALVDQSQSISTHNSVLARLKHLFISYFKRANFEHVDEKTRKAILKGEYIDFVSLLHENSTASSNVNELLTLTVNGESPTHFFSRPEEI